MEARAPTDEALQAVLETIIRRIRLVEQELPHLPVVSYQELLPDTSITAVDRVSAFAARARPAMRGGEMLCGTASRRVRYLADRPPEPKSAWGRGTPVAPHLATPEGN